MALPRIAGRAGQQIDLNVTFFNNGAPADPLAIRRIDIYKGSIKDENLVAQVTIVQPDDPSYPYPLKREEGGVVTDTNSGVSPGVYHYIFDVPSTFEVPDIYFDVWRFIGSADIGTGAINTGGTGPEGTYPDWDDESHWLSKCNRFWLYADDWYVDDGLVVPRIGFEPIDVRLKKPEIRTVEVGMMPLPLYDFDQSLLNVIPRLTATVHIETENCEVIEGYDAAPCRIGVRQGTYRSNPFTVQFTVNTANFFIGSYKYRITLTLPNGETRVSDEFRLTVI